MPPIQEDDKRILLGLIWALKELDLSNLMAALQTPGSHVGTMKGSANNLFWSQLAAWGIADEVKIEAGGLPEGNAAALKNLVAFALTEDGAALVSSGLGFALEDGWPPRQGVMSENAVQMLERTASESFVPAKRQALAKLATLYATGKGVGQTADEAIRLYREAGDLGDDRALNNLAIMHYVGQGVEKDLGAALALFRRAADAGSLSAIDNIGSMYATGEGVPQDFAEALKWYRCAADGGHAISMCNLGDLYTAGNGTPKDPMQAYIWYSLGIAGGYDARQPRDAAAAALSPEQLKEADLFVSQWQPVAPAQTGT